MISDDKIVIAIVFCIIVLASYLYGKSRGNSSGSVVEDTNRRVITDEVEEKIHDIKEKNKTDNVIVVDAPSVDDINDKLSDIRSKFNIKRN